MFAANTEINRFAAHALGACCMMLALAAFSSGAWAQAGFAHEVSGLVSMYQASAKATPVKGGDTFDSGTVFQTGTDGKVILKFADGQIVALGAESALRIGQYHFDLASRRQNISTVELMKGEMRYVAGLIGATNREGVRILAGESMISISKPGGADFAVSVDPDPKEVGYAAVALGEISVRTPYGPISKIESDQYAPWRPGRTPPLPVPLAAAPATVQAAAAELLTTLLPTHTPVAIAPAAKATVASAEPGPTKAAASPDARQAGYVEEVSNGVSIRTRAGATTATAGTTFEAGATFDTGTKGRAVLKFADGQLVVLGPGSTLAVNEYQFDPDNIKASKSALDLVNGAMRVITGAIHVENHEGVSILAGASVVDILNTTPADFTVVVNTRDKEVGVARVTLGEIAVSTPYGPIDRIEADRSNLWGPRQTPNSPIAVGTALAVVQAAVALQLSGLPDNTPVAVAPAARAAAAVAEAKQARAAAAANPQNAQLQATAQATAELAKMATAEAASANQAMAAKTFAAALENMAPEDSVTAKSIAAALENLPPTSAGPVLAQAPAAAAAPAFPVFPAVTPGAGGGCTGSTC